MSQDTISCELHDYVEVVCMYGYQLKLTLKDGRIVEGKAVDIMSSPEKREYLMINNGTQQQVDLTELAKMEVLTPNTRFNQVIFD